MIASGSDHNPNIEEIFVTQSKIVENVFDIFKDVLMRHPVLEHVRLLGDQPKCKDESDSGHCKALL